MNDGFLKQLNSALEGTLSLHELVANGELGEVRERCKQQEEGGSLSIDLLEAHRPPGFSKPRKLSAAMVAAAHGHAAVLQMLVEEYGADLAQVTKKGSSAAHWCVSLLLVLVVLVLVVLVLVVLVLLLVMLLLLVVVLLPLLRLPVLLQLPPLRSRCPPAAERPDRRAAAGGHTACLQYIKNTKGLEALVVLDLDKKTPAKLANMKGQTAAAEYIQAALADKEAHEAEVHKDPHCEFQKQTTAVHPESESLYRSSESPTKKRLRKTQKRRRRKQRRSSRRCVRCWRRRRRATRAPCAAPPRCIHIRISAVDS